jgi:ethanolamine-phosphate cytidylyltransferase
LAHGDDIAIGADGKDAYLEMRQLDKLLIVKRTEGISTTDIVGRLLLMSKEHLYNNESDIEKRERKLSGEHGIPASQINEKNLKSTEDKPRMQHKNVKLYNTTKRIRQFCSNREAKPTDKVVYVCGSFDLLHKGHCEFLEKAAKLGTFLVLGLYDDETVN